MITKMPVKPTELKMTHRSRQGIIGHITDLTFQRVYNNSNHPFCFCVKLGTSLDFSFENLLKIHQKDDCDPAYTHDPEWLKEASQRYDDLSENSLYEMAVESARAYYVGTDKDNTPSDGAKTLYDGTEIKGVQYSFEGRSGGWLSLHHFEGYDFTQIYAPIEETLTEMPYDALVRLYQLILMIHYSTKGTKPEREVENYGSFIFFYNVCSDLISRAVVDTN